MKYALLFLTTLFVSFASIAQDGSELVAPGPHINFEISSYDFGDITQGDKVAYTFEFTNDGDTPLVLSNVKTTCGCTASSWPREPIAPGATSKIDVTFNSTGKIGKQNKVITIMSNGTNSPETVKIITNILKPEATEG